MQKNWKGHEREALHTLSEDRRNQEHLFEEHEPTDRNMIGAVETSLSVIGSPVTPTPTTDDDIDGGEENCEGHPDASYEQSVLQSQTQAKMMNQRKSIWQRLHFSSYSRSRLRKHQEKAKHNKRLAWHFLEFEFFSFLFFSYKSCIRCSNFDEGPNFEEKQNIILFASHF